MPDTPPPLPDTPPAPPPPFPPPPRPLPLPPPRTSRLLAIVIGSVVAVTVTLVLAVVATGAIVAGFRANTAAPPPAETSAPADAPVVADEEEEEEEEYDPLLDGPANRLKDVIEVLDLTADVTYEDGTEVSLSDYERGVSSGQAFPKNTPYVSFAVKIVNTSDTMVDLSSGYFTCHYGDESTEGEWVHDPTRDLGTMPTLRLRPGRTAKTRVACAMPRDEEHLQVQLAPTSDSEQGIFWGTVK